MSRLAKIFLIVSAIAALVASGVLVLPVLAGSEVGPRSGKGVVVFGEDVRVSAPVDGNVQVVFGSVEIDAPVEGDVLVFGGDVTLGPRAIVAGDVISFGGKVSGLDPARVRGRLSDDTTNSALTSSQLGMTVAALNDPFSVVAIALKLTLLAGWLVAALILSLTSGREIRASSVELRVSPFHTFVLGLVAFTSFVLTAIMLSYLVSFVVGIPLLVFLGVFAILTKVYGMVAVFHAVGSMIAAPRTRQQIDQRRWLRGDMAMVTVGLVVVGALRLLPYVGNLIWIGCSLFGVGVALATKFGRREPWFLAWRPADPQRT